MRNLLTAFLALWAASAAALPAPTGFTAVPTGSSGQVALSWNAVANTPAVTGYQIYYATYAPLTATSQLYVTSTSAVITGLPNAVLRYFTVAADDVSPVASAPLSAIPYQAPDATLAWSASPQGNGNKVLLQWTAVPPAYGYQIGAYRVENTAGTVLLSSSFSSLNAVLSVACGSTQSLRLRAVDVAGNTGVLSASIPVSVPCAPLLTAASVNNAALRLTWTTATVPEYIVRYAPVSATADPLPNFEGVTYTSLATPSLTFAAVPDFQSRYYRVYAVDAQGVTSAGSAERGLHAPPLNVKATPRQGNVILQWSAPPSEHSSGITSYQVYYATYSPPDPMDALTSLSIVPSAALGLTLTGLTDEVPYFFAVASQGGGHVGPLSLPVSAIPRLPSPAFTQVLQETGSALSLQWSAVDTGPNTATYSVYRATDAFLNGNTLVLSTSATGAANVPLNGPGHYYWFISVSDSAGNISNLTPAASALFYAPELSAPAVALTLSSNSRVKLEWPPVAGASIYQVDRAAQGATYTAVALAARRTWLTAGTVFLDTTPINGQPISYTVQARRVLPLPNSEVESASNTVLATSIIPPGIPGKAYSSPLAFSTNLTAVVRPDHSAVELRWAASEAGSVSLSGYQLYRGYSFDSLSQIAFVGVSLTAYSDVNVTSPLDLYYGVKAVDLSGTGSALLSGSAKAHIPWGAPQAPTAMVIGSGVHLAWSASSSGNVASTAYAVYRRYQPGSSTTLLTLTASRSYLDLPSAAQGSQPEYSIAYMDSLGILGGIATVSATLNPAAPSGSAPSIVAGIQVQALTGTPIPALISWAPNAENEAVTQYLVYRDATYLGLVSGSSFLDSSAGAGTYVTYSVQAGNSFGLGVSGTTQGHLIAPPAPASLTIVTEPSGNTFFAVSLAWADLSATAGVTGYLLFRDGAFLDSVTQTTYAGATVTPGTTVVFGVHGIIAGVASALSARAELLLPPAPLAPSGFTVTVQAGGVKLAWADQSFAQQYWVYRATYALGSYPSIGERIAFLTGTAMSDGGDATQPVLHYAVAALNYLGRGPASSVSAIPAPGTPTALLATPGSGPQITLSWAQPLPAASATGYSVYRALASAPTPILLASVSTVSHVDLSALSNTAYVYWVKSVNHGVSDFSVPTAAVSVFNPAPAPTGVSATGAAGRVDLRWDPAGTHQGVTGYAIAWQTNGINGLSTTAALPSSFSFPGLLAGQAVTLSLQALNSAGASGSVLAEAQANAAGPAPQPLNFAVTAGSYEAGSATASLLLSWSPLGSGRNALIYRHTAPLGLSLAAGGAASPLYVGTVSGLLNSLSDSAVSSGQAYYYALSSLSADGLPGGESSAIFSPPATPFSYPSLAAVTATAGLGRIDLQWNAPAYAGTAGLDPQPYRLYRYNTVTKPVFKVALADAGFPQLLSGTSFADLAVVNGQSYYYVLSVVDALGREQAAVPSFPATALIPRGPRQAPPDVQVFPGDKSVSFRWVATQAFAAEGLLYNVYRRTTFTAAGFGDPVPSLYKVGPGSSSFVGSVTLVAQTLRDQHIDVDNVINNKTTYYYALSVVNEYGESGKSREYAATPFKPLDPGMAGSSNRFVTATVVGKKDVRLSWGPCPDQDPAQGYTTALYRVYRSVDGGSNYQLRGSFVDSTATAYTYTDLDTQFGASYVYRVVPVDDQGNEGLSYDLQTAVIPTSQNAVLLFRNSFNPAKNETVAVQYTLLQPGKAWVKVFTLQGEYVATLFDEEVSSATPDSPYLSEKKLWDGKNFDGQTVASGVYLLHLESPGFRANARVAVIK